MAQSSNTHQPKEGDEQSFSTTNDPSTDPALQSGNQGAIHGGREPYVPSKSLADSLETPKSREELQAASAALNNKE
ncbi:hypothetical protein [Phaffia rhodozyma]|uniref:Uncharacterized protein n=1 Tax=Phaffia rhodozyma TaxID=264483 RepID=A0A0F7STC0_PHARH|nr:hypothetical protein [Phaffia rhodozyma]